jgi:hypothetical protein
MHVHPLEYGRAYVLSEDIFPNRLSPDSLPNILQHLDRVRTMIYAAKAAWIIEDQGPFNRKIQYTLADRVLPDIRKPLAFWQLRFPYKVLFFHTQFLVLMKFICLHSRPRDDSGKLTSADLFKIGTALFGVTDLIARESERIHSSLSERDRVERIAIELVTGAHLIRKQRLLLDVVRSKYLYVHQHQEAACNPPPDFIEINNPFEETTGLTIQFFFEIGLAVVFYYLRFRDLEISEYPAGDFIVLNARKWLADTKIPTEIIDRFINFLSIGLDDLKSQISEEDKRSLGYDFLVIKERPLLRIWDDSCLPFSFEFLCERLTTGVYWAIFDKLKEFGDEEKFSRYNGYLFEKYVAQLLKEIHDRDVKDKERKYFADTPFRIGKQEYKTPDAVLIGNDYIILIEATASRIKAYSTIARGIREAFVEDCEKIVFKKAAELDGFIQLLRGNQVIINGETLDGSKKIYPVIVAIEEFPRIPPLDDYILQEISKRGLLNFLDLAPLSIVSIEDIEDVNLRNSLLLRIVLDEWQSSGRFPYTSLSVFLHDRFGQISLFESSMVSKIFHDVINEATVSVFGIDFDELQGRALSG